jgi:hypothetical protein
MVMRRPIAAMRLIVWCLSGSGGDEAGGWGSPWPGFRCNSRREDYGEKSETHLDVCFYNNRLDTGVASVVPMKLAVEVSKAKTRV